MDSNSKAIEPLVSIEMLTYNRSLLIREAIQSVLDQTYQNWELLIIDDGSTDTTAETVDSFKDTRIRYLPNTANLGVSRSRIVGLAASKGKYIAVLDSDDSWTGVTKLSEQVSFLEQNPGHAVVGTFITVIDATGNEIGETEYLVDDASIRGHLLLRNQFAHSSVLMRADMVSEAGGYADMPIGEDYELFLRLGMQGAFANIPSYLTKYRVHSGGVSSDNTRMAKAVHEYILTYRKVYPRSTLALIKSFVRIMLVQVVRDARVLTLPTTASRRVS